MAINSSSVLLGRVVATLHHMSDEGRHVAKRIMDIFSIIPQIIIFYNLSLSWIHRGRNDRGGALLDYFIKGGGGHKNSLRYWEGSPIPLHGGDIGNCYI